MEATAWMEVEPRSHVLTPARVYFARFTIITQEETTGPGQPSLLLIGHT